MSLNLETILPLLKGVEEQSLYKSLKTLAPTEYLDFYPHKKGYLIDASCIVNSPYVRVIQNFWGQELSYDIYTIYAIAGVTIPNNAANYSPKYDVINNIYSLIYTPRPYKYYNDNAYIKVIAPSIDPTTGLPIVTSLYVYVFLVHYIQIENMNDFKESLKDVIKGTIK